MFGYVKISEDELLVKNLKKYKSAYCALCKQIGSYSQVARALLSYDMVFCVLLSESEIPIEKKPCKNRFFKKCKKCNGDQTLQYLACVSIILQYHKLNDDVIDGKKSRKFIMAAIEKGYKKAKNEYPDIDFKIETRMNELLNYEKEKCQDFELLDSCFSGILYDVFESLNDNNEYNSIKGEIAQHVAAWVYWFDMLQDVEQDKREENFNVVILSENEEQAKQKINDLLTEHICEAERLCDILPFSDSISIVHNIISIGLPKQMNNFGLELNFE